MELMKGRPADCTGRLEREMAVYDLLDKLGIEYVRVDHEEANTMEACEEIDRALGTAMCKNLFLCNRQKTNFYLLMMPGDKPFKTKDLSQQIGSARLSFAEHRCGTIPCCLRPVRSEFRRCSGIPGHSFHHQNE